METFTRLRVWAIAIILVGWNLMLGIGILLKNGVFFGVAVGLAMILFGLAGFTVRQHERVLAAVYKEWPALDARTIERIRRNLFRGGVGFTISGVLVLLAQLLGYSGS